MPEPHTQRDELELERDSATAPRDPGEDGPVVRKHLGWEPPGGGGSAEADHHVGRLERHPGVAAHDEAGVVVDLVEDLYLGSIREGPVGDVELPTFVGLISFEPHETALGTLVRLRSDEAPPAQHPPDRRDRRGLPQAALEMERDRLGTGVMSQFVEFLAHSDDLVLDHSRDPLRTSVRSTRPRHQPRLALDQKPSHQHLDPTARDPVVTSHLALRATLANDRCDHQPRHRHDPHPHSEVCTMSRDRCERSPELPHHRRHRCDVAVMSPGRASGAG
jgi:hypothetical protein